VINIVTITLKVFNVSFFHGMQLFLKRMYFPPGTDLIPEEFIQAEENNHKL